MCSIGANGATWALSFPVLFIFNNVHKFECSVVFDRNIFIWFVAINNYDKQNTVFPLTNTPGAY